MIADKFSIALSLIAAFFQSCVDFCSIEICENKGNEWELNACERTLKRAMKFNEIQQHKYRRH